MRAKYPSTWLRTPNATRSMHERPRMSRYSEFYYLDCERGRLVRSSLARLIPPRQPRTYERERENGYFSRPLEKLLPPLEPHGQRGGGGIFGIEKGRRERECVVFELRLRAKEVRKRAGQPRVFFLFLYVFFLSSNAEQIAYRRRFSFTLTRLPMVTIGIHI